MRIEGGMCCGLEGRKGIYRILGMRYHVADDDIHLLVRKELKHKIGKMQDVLADDMIYLKPPYKIPY